MQNIDILKRARAPKRAIFTRLSTEFWTEIEKPDFDTKKYRAKYNRICALSKEINEIDSRYRGLLLEDETITEVKIEEEFEGCENYVQGMFDIENKYLSRCETARDRVDGSLVESAANSVVNTESKRTIRLPKVELPKYKGNLEDWLSWWGQFSKINDDETLGDVDKFHYLLQAVVEGSRAQRLVCSYPITEDNYPKVVQALKDRFGDKNLLIEHYIRRLLKLVVSNARKEILPLDEIYDDLTAHLKNLESLGVNTEMAGVFLYPLVESSLPLDIIQVWQRNPAVGYGIKEEGAENGDKSDASGRLQALMDFLRDEVKGAERMAFAKENFEGNSSMRATGSQLKTPRKTPPTVSNLFGSAFKRKCIFCQRDNHLSSECFVASRLTPSERDQRIKEAKVCFKCLKGNHLKRECRADIKCRNCEKDHLDIFCNKIALKQGGNNSFKGETSKVVNEGNATCTGVNMSARTCANDILLMTSVAKLKGAKETKEVKVLFDTGSHYSYIKRSIVEKLGLNKIGEISLEKSLFGGGNMKEALHGKYVLKLGSLTNKIDVDIVALDQPEICARIPPIPRGRLLYKLKRKRIYIHPSNFRNEEIDILIGSDYFGQLLTGKVVHLGEDLTAVETKLGWTLMGQSPVVGKEDKVQIALNMLVARNNLKDLWELDILGIQDPIEVVSKKKRETELKEHFIKNIKRDEDQRYSVALPWKCERNNVPSNLEIAQRRLEACTTKLRKEKMVIEYSTILQEWEREGLIERIEENRPQKKGHYLPHRPVFKAESRTTPLRPVFDASCRSYNGLSLNDYLEKGPNLLEKIPEIVIRFREKGIGVLADIRKAFQMITVQLQDQDFLRFLWWDQTDPMKLTVFRHKRVVFGLNCSPFILGAVIDHHLNSVQGPAAEIAKTMARSFYMDNLVTSLSSQEEVQQFQNTAVNIMEMAKMDLREWEFNLPVSNSKEEKGTTTKVLGLVWDKVEDVLNCDVSIEKDLSRRLTKRIILSKIQQVFDPLGVYSPIFLPPKLLLQRSWELKIGWDSQLPEDMDREFRTWYSQIGLLSQIKIPRHIWFDQTNKNEIHVFCDASKSAYAAVAYMRSEVQGGVHLSLLWSKSRLAPTKRVTIPRLELLACVLGARLVKSISTALTNSCPVTLWTDSSTVMAWLKRKNEWNVFVRNRVQEIRDTVNNENWKFVYGKFNPADLPSRGCSIVQFVSTNWWEGPEWLKGEKESWPSFEPTIDEEEIVKEKRKTLQAHTTLIVEANRWFLDRRSKRDLVSWLEMFLECSDILMATDLPVSPTSLCFLPYSPSSADIARSLKAYGIRTLYKNSSNLLTSLRHPYTKSHAPPDPLHSVGAVYSVSCEQCSATYVGETGRSVAIRMSEHSRNISNQDTRSLLYQHTLNTGHTFNTNHPTIHYRRIHNQHQRLVLESIESHRHKSINRKIDLPDAYRALLALQIMAWVLRFLDNARRIPTERGNLKVIELERAERKLLKLVQQETFPGKQAPKNGLKTIKSVEGLWRHNQKPIQTPGAALPTNRIGLGKPFEVTGVDLLGPLYLKGGSKVWVALFTCAVYRAVHLEIVRTLEANTFLLALKRFICRRGRPGKIYSDNGTNFSKTNELLKRLDWGEIERESSVKRIQWIFIHPSAPWWGGFWERLVRVVKSLLVRKLGFSKLNYVQLETALCEVESIINNRALSYISEDDQDLIPLTPQMFLQTNANNEFPELEKIRVNSFTRKYKILSKLNEELKQRFRKEYLGVLIQRAENKRELCIKEGDLVLIGQDNTKRILWPVGKIIKLYLGKDGVNRVARVKTSTGEWLRPVQRLFPLEISSEETPEKVTGDKKPLTIKTRSGREVRKPIRARAPKRAIFTRLSTEFWTEIEKPDFDTEKYRAKYNRICALSKEINEIDSRYSGLLLEDETITEVKIEEEFEGCENYVQGMFDIENKYLSRCETARDRVDGSLVESAANSVVNTESKRTIRLPKVELPKYKGNLEDWLSWWGQFSKINDDETLGDVDKFHYLLQAVVEGSRAQRLVCSYPITEDNYPKVVQALKDRFGDKNLLIEHYIRRLLKLVVSNARKEILPLDEIYDDLTAHLKNLESLGVNTEMAGVFLYPLVESSLPLDIIQVWQRNPAVGYGIKEEGAENGDKSDASGRLQALMDFLRDEVKGAERMAFAEENFEGNSSMRATGSQLRTPRKTPPTVSNLFGSAFKRKCIFCQRDNHLSSECFVASRLTPSERDQRIKEAKVCFKCLKGNHLKRECRADIKCRNCEKDHLDIFCNKIALKQGGNNSFKGETSKVVNEGNATCTGVNMSARTCANDILLMTSVAKLKGAKETKEVKVLFDTGSHYSYIKRSIVEKLGLNKIGEISLEKSLFGGGNMKEALHGKYVLKLGSLTNKIDVDIVALDQPEICARIPPIPRGRLLYKLKRKRIYIHPSNFRNEEIDILIGSDYFGQLLTGKVVFLGEDLTAVETKLGWTLMGQSPVVGKEDKVQIALNMLVARNNLKDLWELDILGIQDPIEVVSKKKRETELKEHFIKNMKRDEDQRYSVALPWKCERNNIPSNLEIAQRRLEACTTKLRKEKMVIEYSTILQEWEREGLIERIEENRPQKKGHYLPHRPVFKAESRTTPLRPVFDASCRSYNGLSLNDYLEKGPNLLEKIPEIVIRFREKGIGVLADIRKAFQMITVQLQDQDFLRFLWWDQTDPMKLTVFRHKRVVFGLNCSPFILGAVIDHHLNSVQGPAAEIAKTMARSFYMDNLVTSLSSQEEVQQFQNTAVNIMEMAKMDLREWEFNLPVSNSKEEKGTTTKVLGLVWDKVEDVLNCDVSIEKDLSRRLTKRIILSKIQQVFDPLGVYSPIFLPPKLLLQRSWELKIGWDSQLPEDMDREFRTWYSQIGLLSQIKIPRHIWFDQTNKNEIHVFCDASKSADAAVAYMRSEVQGGVHLSLLWSKSRLAPTKRVTIPRLELLACVLGARLVKSISTALTNSCPVTLWTDSSTVMAWLKRKNEWNVFVRNRVQEIRDTVNNENWKFVYGKFNPADLPSRGCSIVQFVSTNWWEGPEWLKGEKESWPSFEPTIDEEEIVKEKRKTLQAHTTLIVEANRWFLDRRSKYSLNIRIMAWVLRFFDNARRIPTERGNLKVIELERAERKLLKLVQQETFPGKQAPKNGLKTIKSVEGLWCVETKLLHGQDSEVFKRPILLPRNHPLVEQMVREIHQQNGHGGAQFILSQLREKFWIIGGRRLIKQIIGKCVICRRHNQKPIQTPGAALPTNRIGLGKPFEVTGVDLLGPLYLKGGSKVWVALFTCAVYRAVHLEIVRTLEANTFLLALKRFICRRGRPGKIYSDNGTNFSKTNELLKRLDWGEIERESSVKRIQWIFIHPSAPWWGGFWERLVRVVKSLLVRKLGFSKLNYVQLETALCEVESIINNRALSYISEDDQDLIPLTPQMFLQTNANNEFPELEKIRVNSFTRKYKILSKLNEELKQRFRKEYLGVLIQRAENKRELCIKEGDLVLIGQDNTKIILWPVGKIIKLYLGKDGVNRVARVKTSTGEWLRPVQRLFPLEISSEETPEKVSGDKKTSNDQNKIRT
ncbi:hypothetical protein LAZ67_11002128 [Cordylochernes scorpioides]|uniref:Integrase catalytic domain-containing protein n=1 Tax=Cordylochernes scorpioides TaxID=51811 RepID=A0ABY6KZ03_9ARAC|nr:hypothetical protein LAZ67_11002128 [Cordylochernes scorpioides]